MNMNTLFQKIIILFYKYLFQKNKNSTFKFAQKIDLFDHHMPKMFTLIRKRE